MPHIEIAANECPNVNLGIDFGNEFTYLAVAILSVVILSVTLAAGPFWIGL